MCKTPTIKIRDGSNSDEFSLVDRIMYNICKVQVQPPVTKKIIRDGSKNI